MIREVICGYGPGAEMGATLAVFDYNKRIGFEAIRVRGFSADPETPWLERAASGPMSRYELTVDAAEGVVIFSPDDAKGIETLLEICRRKGRPHWVFSHDPKTCAMQTGRWVAKNRISKLAIFGLREEKSPGIQDRVFVSVLDIIGQASVASMLYAEQKKEKR